MSVLRLQVQLGRDSLHPGRVLVVPCDQPHLYVFQVRLIRLHDHLICRQGRRVRQCSILLRSFLTRNVTVVRRVTNGSNERVRMLTIFAHRVVRPTTRLVHRVASLLRNMFVVHLSGAECLERVRLALLKRDLRQVGCTVVRDRSRRGVRQSETYHVRGSLNLLSFTRGEGRLRGDAVLRQGSMRVYV